MQRLNLWLIIVCVWLGFAQPSAASESAPVDTGKVVAQLVSDHISVMPGADFYVALRTEIDPLWHTYWRNPGDSGEHVQITWALPGGLTVGDIIWPLPAPIATGPIINYGFDGVPYFVMPAHAPESAKTGDIITLTADIYYLVCKDICIPEKANLSLQMQIGDSKIDPKWDGEIRDAIIAAPKAGDISAKVAKSGDGISFEFTNLPEGDFSGSYFFPYAQGVVDHSAPQKARPARDLLTIKAVPGYDWQNGKQPKEADGLLRFRQDGVWTGQLLQVTVDSAAATAAPAASSGGAKGSQIGFWGALIGALIGGVILNFMPCVFPVISLKALSLAKSSQSQQGQIQKEALAYLAGILVTFIGLIVLILISRRVSQETGWGFQLQSPGFIAGLTLLFFAIGLNLLGVFELTPRWAGMGQKLSEKPGLWGSFFTGVLAVIVATPCTAPFMAGAIGYALTQPAYIVIAIFAALGFGFALPFLLIAYIPALRQRLPKPGAWMVRFRQFLAFPIFATVIWLIWVLIQQAGDGALVPMLLALLGFGFAIWLMKGKGRFSRPFGILILLSSLAVPFSLNASVKSAPIASNDLAIAWSPEKIKELRAGGQAVFVDFTAAWCVSCKVNEKLVLGQPETKALFERTNTVFMVADWTNKNEAIAAELARHGRSGIPLYLLYPPGDDEAAPEILPQILTQSILEKRLTALTSNSK